MRTTGLIAGGVGVALALGFLVILGAAGVIGIAATAPSAQGSAADLRAAVVDYRDDIGFCGAGHPAGKLRATVVVEAGRATHVRIDDAQVPAVVAHCVAETLVAASWPDVTAAAVVPIRFE